jgi:hypothetical protein
MNGAPFPQPKAGNDPTPAIRSLFSISKMVRQILTSGDTGKQLVFVASYGMDNNMPPSNEAFEVLLDYGAGPELQYWATHCDTGGQVGNPTSWVSFPTNYIFVGAEALSYGQGWENYVHRPERKPQLSPQEDRSLPRGLRGLCWR